MAFAAWLFCIILTRILFASRAIYLPLEFYPHWVAQFFLSNINLVKNIKLPKSMLCLHISISVYILFMLAITIPVLLLFIIINKFLIPEGALLQKLFNIRLILYVLLFVSAISQEEGECFLELVHLFFGELPSSFSLFVFFPPLGGKLLAMLPILKLLFFIVVKLRLASAFLAVGPLTLILLISLIGTISIKSFIFCLFVLFFLLLSLRGG